jgi:predicted SnoaL-like aldol condensation-catalyzing enzyme
MRDRSARRYSEDMQRPNFSPYLLAAALLGLGASLGGHAGAAAPDNREVANRLVAQFVEAENTMNVALFDDIFLTNYIQHDADVPPGLAGVKKAFAEEFKELAAAHITAHSTIESVLVDGDRVVLVQVTTIDKGAKHYEERGFDEWRIADGHFAEHWDSDAAPRPVAAPAK